MTDTPQAEVPQGQEPMPSSTNAEAPEPQQAAAPTGETPKEVSAGVEGAEVSIENETELPEGVSERTRREFDKLRTQLREERANRMKNQSVFEQLRPSQQPLTQDQINSYVDPQGNVDINGLNKAIYSAQTRAANAEQTVQRWIEDQQTQEAHRAHPELNPNNTKFDQVLHNKTRALLMDSMLNPTDYSGRPLTYKQAADLAKGITAQALTEAEKMGAQKAVESLTPKEQASLEATGRSDRRTQVGDMDSLRQRTRKGDMGAIMERLKGIPTAGR